MRPPRLDYPGARHHVMNRGARRADIFFGRRSRELFLALLAELPERFGLQVHAYALMPNHYHLMVESPGNLSVAMRYLGATYVRRLNQMQGWDGPLFRGRFHNKVVDADSHWAHLLLYLHLNPIRANLPEEHLAWTSHFAYLEGEPPPWLSTPELLARHGGPAGYLEAFTSLRHGEREAPDGFDPDHLWSPHDTGRVASPRHPRRSTPAEAITDVLAVTGRGLREATTSVQGRHGNPVRWLLAWWMARRRIERAEICRHLGVRFSQVHRMIRRVEERRHDDPQLARWTRALEDSTDAARVFADADGGARWEQTGNGAFLTPTDAPAQTGPSW